MRCQPSRPHPFFVLAAVVLAHASVLRATVDQTVVINEVCMFPVVGQDKFVEILNRGPNTISTLNWWSCDQPISSYTRLLKVPQSGGPAAAPPIVLAPGDFLVIRFHPQFPPPSGAYSFRSNMAGTTTHLLQLNIPGPAIPSFLNASAGNFSIWDQSPPGNPDDPAFDVPQAMRDFVSWGVAGTYTGLKRGCVASNPVAALWPAPMSGDCEVPTPPPVFAAVSTLGLSVGSGVSINSNNGSSNNPTDYFLAPATEGEPNVMPGDIDGDLDMDTDDYSDFVECLGEPATTLPCSRADFDGSQTVDCGDWPVFETRWLQYAPLPPPTVPSECNTCVRGDVNGDGLINGEDVGAWMRVFSGTDVNPLHRCAADANANGALDCEDLAWFVQLAMGSVSDCAAGDVNFDGVVDGRDIPVFLEVLFVPACRSNAQMCSVDVNRDLVGSVDDAGPFVVLLLSQ